MGVFTGNGNKILHKIHTNGFVWKESEVKRGGVSCPMYPQVSSLPQLTLASADSFEIIWKENTFLTLFWRLLRKGHLLYKKFRPVFLTLCFKQLCPDKMTLEKKESAIK